MARNLRDGVDLHHDIEATYRLHRRISEMIQRRK
jgi:hypothetical protein